MADALDSTPAPIGRLLSLAADAALSGMGASVARAVDDATAAVLARVGRSAPARDTRGRFAKRADIRTADDLLREIAEGIDRQEAAARPELPPEPLLPAADRAHALHLRRQLEAAAEHGAALLATLGLPRLVGPDTIIVDPVAAGDALDLAIAALDALDADPDLEDGGDDEFTGDDELSLGWREAVSQLDLGHGQDDAEPTLGAPERSPWVASMTTSYYQPANGSRQWRGFRNASANQTRWAQGSRLDGEGEACIGYDAGDDSTPDEDGLSRPWLDADRVFGLRVDGDCCAPHILDGGAVHVDKKAEPVAGDFVAIFFEGWRDNRYGMHGWVKRLSMSLPSGTRWPFYSAPGNELRPVLAVESLNPPMRYMLDVTKVHAVFKVVDVLPPAHAITAPGYMAARR